MSEEELLVEADDYEKNIYFLERDIEEDEFKIFYNAPESFLWKEHPENPFKVSDVIERKKTAEKYDALGLDHKYMQLSIKIKILSDKLEAVEKVVTKYEKLPFWERDLVTYNGLLQETEDALQSSTPKASENENA